MDSPLQLKRAPLVYGKRSTTLPSISLSPSPPSTPFQFEFRQRLKQLDQDDPQGDSNESVSMGTAFNDAPTSPPRALSPALHATLAEVDDVPPDSPPVHRRTRRLHNSVPSDSEQDEQYTKSPPLSPVRYPITTPHSRSSPTPPTSGEILMPGAKAKGKAPVRDVLPLVFDTEQLSSAERVSKPRKTHRGDSLGHPRTKAPTKKDRREAAFESSRIAADRHVQVTRTQQQRHSLSTFFANLKHDNIPIPSSGAELPSDPIERFSSPTDKSIQVPPSNSLFGAPSQLLTKSAHVGTSNQPSSYSTSKSLPPAAADSDDEMPSVISILQESGKQKKLQAFKQLALQHADAKAYRTDDSEDDDDLLVVKDDMHAVAREEAAQRRLDKAQGSPVKDMPLLRRLNHPSVRPVVSSPRKLSRKDLQELAKPSFARTGKETKTHLSKKQLDQLMLTEHTEGQLRSNKRNEEEWLKRGGKLSREFDGDDPQTSLSQKLEAYAQQGLKAVEISGNGESDEESDEDYNPDQRGSTSPEVEINDSERSDDMVISQVPRPSTDDVDDEVVLPLRRNKSGQRHPRLVMGSDDEMEEPAHLDSSCVQRDSTSSMESQTEDENDKENSAKLMYDRSDDKENKAVVRHELSEPESVFDSRLGSLPSAESDDATGGLSQVASATDLHDTTNSPKEVRSPLKDISKDEDDPFLSPSSKSPFTERLLSAKILPSCASTSTLSLGSPPTLRCERTSRINRLSLDSQNDENDSSGFRRLQPSFLEMLHSQTTLEPSLAPLNPLQNGGISQLFSAEDRSSTKSIDGVDNHGLSLTLDVGLKPALEVSGTLRQKAENIFEKEQEFVVAAAVQQNDTPKDLLYVNDHGFFTQTRPEGSSPQMYRMTPSQASKFVGTQIHPTQTEPFSVRPPLRTLSFTVTQESSPEPQPLRRLRKRSPSPLEQISLGKNSNPGTKLNAFDILGKVPKPPSKIHKEKHEKSEFVAVEAEESDEEVMFGFGRPKECDDDDDDNEQEKIVEGLLDDAAMDVETEAVDLVQEKFREHEEEDDQRLQKLHQDAIEGKFRMKRRDRGVGFEDESDEDDDNDAHIRQRMHKKRKIEGDNLEVLGQHEETRAFYDTYHQDFIDEDDEFKHLREDTAMPADDGDNAQGEDPEEQETMTVDEIYQRVREMAQNNTEVEVLDPEDTSWIDQSIVEDEDAVRVKVVERRQNKSTPRHTNTGQMDFDVERSNRYAESEQEREQMKSWAKHQAGQLYGTGRSGNSTAVTGHRKGRTGSGSLRSTQLSNPPSVSDAPKTKTSSLLSTVSSRSGRFK